MNRFQKVSAVGYWFHAALVLLGAAFLVYLLLAVDWDEEAALATLGVIVHGVLLIIFGNEVRSLRRFPVHHSTAMLDDIEMATSSENAAVVGVRRGVFVVAIVNLIGLVVLLLFATLFAYYGIGNLRHIDEWEFMVALTLSLLSLVTGVFAVVFTVTNLRLRVLKPIGSARDSF